MTTTAQLIEKIQRLPPERQEELLEFVEKLEQEQKQPPLVDSYGDLRDLGLPDLSLEDFQQARREMWRNFPRDFPGEEI